MESAKIRLSEEELALIKNADLILTKNRVLAKVNQLLCSLQESQRHMLLQPSALPESIRQSTPKISRGENYEGLPWLMLDYPRSFTRQDTLAIRTMFWWGRFFSCTLHLSGSWKLKYQDRIVEKLSRAPQEWQLNINSEWDHRVSGSNYFPALRLNNVTEAVISSPFMKIAAYAGVDEWELLSARLNELYGRLLILLED